MEDSSLLLVYHRSATRSDASRRSSIFESWRKSSCDNSQHLPYRNRAARFLKGRMSPINLFASFPLKPLKISQEMEEPEASGTTRPLDSLMRSLE
jgi:hypothetical protein